MIRRVVEIKKISKDNQEKIYKKLLTGDLKVTARVNTRSDCHRADIDIMGCDFCLNSWTYNYYVRPPKAVQYERYKSLARAWQALNKTVNTKTTLSLDEDLMVYDSKGNYLFILRMN